MKSTSNFDKHQHRNPIQRKLIANFYRDVYAVLESIQPESILDAGCGEGVTLNNLHEKGIGKKLEGFDFLKTAVDIGNKTFPNLAIKQANIYDLSYKDNSFDLVLCNEVLEHLEDPKKALKELKRVTKKYLLLSVPNEPYFMMAQFFRGRHLSRFGNHPEHIQHWTSSGFKKFVESQGLKVLTQHQPFAWTLLLVEKN